jgi:hypothetical protein
MTVAYVEDQANLAGATTAPFATAIAGSGGNGSDLVIAMGLYGSSETNPGFTDNINTGAYTKLLGAGGLAVANFGGTIFQIGYKICNASGGAGTFAVTATGSAPQKLTATHFNGFTKTAVFPGTDIANNNGASGTAVTTPSFNTAIANEYILSWICSNDSYSNPIATGWNTEFNGNTQLQFNTWAANPVAQGTAAVVNVTKGGSNAWVAFCFAFYDGVGGQLTVSSLSGSGLGPG